MERDRRSGAITRIDITDATRFVVATGNAGLRGALQRLVWPLTTVWGLASALVMLFDQTYHPSWRVEMYACLFLAFTPIAAGMLFLVIGAVRAQTLPDTIVPGLLPHDTFRGVMAKTAAFTRQQAAKFGSPRRSFTMWLNLFAAALTAPVLWQLWQLSNVHSPGSLGWRILTGGFVVTGLSALVLALVEAHAASRPSFVYHRTIPGAAIIRWLLLQPPIIGMWLVLEWFRTGQLEEFVFSSGSAGDTMASEFFSLMTFTFLWLFWVAVVGRSLGSMLTVDELIHRYRGAQVTLLRSFKDDEAGVDFAEPVKPDSRWTQIRLEPQITLNLQRFGPVVAISGDTRTIDRVGARRVQLSDDVWQSVVTRWIDASMMIVMLAGKTPSVRWELETIIARERIGALLLLFPPRTTDSLGRVDNDDKIDRLGIIRACFADTQWASALGELEQAGVIGLMFRSGGALEVIASDTSSNEDYGLAVRLAVHCMLVRDDTSSPSAPLRTI